MKKISPKENRNWLTLREAAEELGIPLSTLTWRINNWKIATIQDPQSRRRVMLRSTVNELKQQRNSYLEAIGEQPLK